VLAEWGRQDAHSRELQLVRGMLRALLTHCLLGLDAGWTCLQRVAFTLRQVPDARCKLLLSKRI